MKLWKNTLSWLGVRLGITKGDGKGEINMMGVIMMGISMVFIGVGFIMFPTLTSATDTVLAYSMVGNATINTAYFTGLTAVVGIVPLLVLLGFIVTAIIGGFLGLKVASGKSSGNISPGSLMLAGIGIVFIAVGEIMFPVALDGVATVLHGAGHGISASYTGLASILRVAPMLLQIAYVAATVLVGYFGVKGLGGKMSKG